MKSILPRIILRFWRLFHIERKIPDDIYLKVVYQIMLDRKLNIQNPLTFNEKLQWLKIHDRKPEYSKMVDKYEAKRYVSDIIGDKYIVPTYGVWNSFDEIDFSFLPDKFVLKTTHDSGGVVICTDKGKFDLETAKNKLLSSMNKNYFYQGREWPYKNVKPRIIAEKYIEQIGSNDLPDYKFFCFNGHAKIILVCSERFSVEGLKEDFFDRNWEHLDLKRKTHGNSSKIIEKPCKFEEMLTLAEKLSKKIPFLRVDFYEINGDIYFGELTFYPTSGFEAFNPEEWDSKLGTWLDLPQQ